MLKGIDISSWQGQPDFNKVKEDADFVIVKATEGVGFRDPQLTRNQTECRKLGITLGYYAFVRPDLGNKPEDEAKYFLDQIGALKPGELLFLDFEVAYADRVNWCKKWLDYVYEATGVKAPIYLNKTLQANSDWTPVIDADYGLWLADYTYNPDSPVPNTQWEVMAFRQYSNAQAISGINGNVDANVFYGDKDSIKAYGYKGSVTPPTDCEAEIQVLNKSIADLKHKLEAKGKEISALEGKLSTLKKDFGILSTQYDLLKADNNAKTTQITNLTKEVTRLQNQKFYLHEIVNLFIVWLKTNGDSKPNEA